MPRKSLGASRRGSCSAQLWLELVVFLGIEQRRHDPQVAAAASSRMLHVLRATVWLRPST